MNEIATTTNQPVSAFYSQDAFESAQRMALALTSSSLVPAQYQGKANIGNAIIALEMAQRINASPLLVMQNLYVVQGGPAWSSKFLIATFNMCGRFSAIRYEWRGEEGTKERACRAWAIEKETQERVKGPWIDWNLISAEGWDAKKGSKWITMPEKMFQYRAAAWMIDTVAPEISMGIPTSDQVSDVGGYDKAKDVTPPKTLDDLLDKGDYVDTETGEIITDEAQDNEKFAGELKTRLENASNYADIDDVVFDIEKMDKRSKIYKELRDLVNIRISELDQEEIA